MMVRLVPIIAGLLPIVAINASYLIALFVGKVPACIPLLTGCTSISATGRYPPASYLFKATMLPDAIILMVYWLLCSQWLQALQHENNPKPNRGSIIGITGCAGALFLILYVTFLGSQGPFYEFMRRFGVYLYFLLTILAQIMLAHAVLTLPKLSGLLRSITRAQLWLGMIPFGLGVLNLILKNLLSNADHAENIIEWIVALLMHLYFILSFFAWRKAGFNASFGVRQMN